MQASAVTAGRAAAESGPDRGSQPEPDRDVLGSGQLGSGFAWAAGARIGAYAAALLSGPLLARMLTPDELGDYFLATTVATVGAMLALMGLSGVALREVSSALGLGRPDGARAAIVATVGLACITGAATAGLLLSPVGHLLAVDVLHSERLDDLRPLLAAWMVLFMAGILATNIWRGLGNVRLAVVLGDFGPKAAFAFGVAVLWLVSRAVGLETVLWLWIGVSAVLVGAWTILLARRTSSFPAGRRMPGLSLAGAGIAILVTGIMWQALDQIDLVILANTAPHHDVALYGAAARISLLLAVPLILVEFVISPVVGALSARGEVDALQVVLRRGATIAMIPTALGAIVVLVGGRWILEGLYGSYYGQAWPVLAVLALGDLAFVLTGSCGLVLWMAGYQRLTAAVATVFGVATLGAAIVAAHAFGMLGLAITMVIGIVGQNGVLLVLARRRLGVWTHTYLRPREIVGQVASVIHAVPDAPAVGFSSSVHPSR